MIDALSEQIDEADKELRKLAKSDSTCSRRMSVPGVGPLTAVRFAAALDSIDRLSSAHKVEAYLGLTAGEHSSSERQRGRRAFGSSPTRSSSSSSRAARRCVMKRRRPAATLSLLVHGIHVP
jgi:transposase